MDKENDKYEYMFITDGDYCVDKQISLLPPLNQLRLCLNSEGVVITTSSIVKCIDVYLRLIGLSHPKDKSTVHPIMVLCDMIIFEDIHETFENDPDKARMVSELFDMFNEYLDENRKFPQSDLEQIKAKFPIIVKDVSIFCNDIFNRLLEEYDDSTLSVTAYIDSTGDPDLNDCRLSMGINYYTVLKASAFSIRSTVLSSAAADIETEIVTQSFPKEVQDRIEKIWRN